MKFVLYLFCSFFGCKDTALFVCVIMCVFVCVSMSVLVLVTLHVQSQVVGA